MCVFDPTVQESRDVNPLESTRPVEVTAENGHSVRSVLIALAPDDPTCVVLDGRIVLGRSPDCDVVIDAPSVSRRHAALFWEGAVLNVEDLGSANGTYLDARPVRRRALVAAGMTLRLGEWLGGVEEVSAERIEDAKFREILPGVLGGAVLRRVLRPAMAAATSDIPVLLVGATGVGKERVAAAIHQTSGRPGPLHAVNCASIPAPLAEAEFFGYVKGAFTGAARANLGHVLAADKGTLFLDEVTDLPPGIQPLFLRVLDQREIVPLGQTRARRARSLSSRPGITIEWDRRRDPVPRRPTPGHSKAFSLAPDPPRARGTHTEGVSGAVRAPVHSCVAGQCPRARIAGAPASGASRPGARTPSVSLAVRARSEPAGAEALDGSHGSVGHR